MKRLINKIRFKLVIRKMKKTKSAINQRFQAVYELYELNKVVK